MMYSKHSSVLYFTLAIVVTIVYGKTPKEILFPTSKPVADGGEKANVNSSAAEVEERYYQDQNYNNQNQNFGNSGTNFPGNNGGSFGNSGTNYPGNNNNDYNPSGSGSVGSSGTYYPGNNSPNNNRPNNNQQNNYPENNRPNNNQQNNYPGNNRPNNNRPNNSGGNEFNPAPGTMVAFNAIRANTNTGNSQQVRFDRTITDEGYGWNPSESYFECYHPGTYVFSWSAVSPSNSETRLSLYENGRETGHHIWADRNGYQSASETAILNLNRGARVELKLTEGRLYEPSNSGRGYTTFSGFKLN